MAEQINTTGYKANLDVFSETLQRLAEKDSNIIAVTSDVAVQANWSHLVKNFLNKWWK